MGCPPRVVVTSGNHGNGEPRYDVGENGPIGIRTGAVPRNGLGSAHEPVLDDGRETADGGDDRTDKTDPAADTDLDQTVIVEFLELEESGNDNGHYGEYEGQKTQHVVDLGEPLSVHESGENHDDELKYAAYEADERSERVFQGTGRFGVYIPSGCTRFAQS